MNIFQSLKTCFTDNLNSAIENVQHDIDTFTEIELRTYVARQDGFKVDDSVIANIALFDLSTLDTEPGYNQMRNLMVDKYDQKTEKRLMQELHQLYIRYGMKTIRKIRERVVESMPDAYGIDSNVVEILDRDFNYFWMVPFIKNSYSAMLLGEKKQ